MRQDALVCMLGDAHGGFEVECLFRRERVEENFVD